MTRKTNRFRFAVTGTLLATAALVATVPFNMGGCGAGDINVMQLGDAVGKGIKSQSISDRNANAIGQSVSLAATNRYGVTKNDRLTTYVVLVGQTIASRTPKADQPWVFGVLDTDKVNAFSAPGGYVWVTRGAIEQMQDESELAGVLAHEVGHVVKGHGLDMARAAGTKDAFTEGLSSAGKTAAFAQLGDTMAEGVLDKGFSQNQEFEADSMGVKFVIAAGYDPNGFLHFLQRMDQKQKSGGDFFSTHPGMDDRIKKITDQISSSGAGGTGATLKDRFMQYTSKTAVGSLEVTQ